MSAGRFPAHVEVSAMIRAAEAAGGFASVIARGERDAGTILILTIERGTNARLWERMPSLDGARKYAVVRSQDTENKNEFDEYLTRRNQRDPDCWIVELDVADAERFIAQFAG